MFSVKSESYIIIRIQGGEYNIDIIVSWGQTLYPTATLEKRGEYNIDISG